MALPDLYEQRLKLIECAEEKGFYCYHIAEHHGSPLNTTPSPSLFLAAAAQRTTRIRLGTLVYVLPAYNPLRLIEEICMLDNLSRGRLDVGVGRGISPIEISFFNIDVQQSRDMFREALDAMTSALATASSRSKDDTFPSRTSNCRSNRFSVRIRRFGIRPIVTNRCNGWRKKGSTR